MSNKVLVGFLGLIVLASLLMAVPALIRPGSGGNGAEHGDLVPWQQDLDAALQQAQQQNKRVLIDFTADWCPPCQQMKREVFTQQSIADSIAAGYVPVKVDLTDPDQAQRSVAQRFDVNAIPTLVILDGQGQVLKTQIGALDAAGMTRWLATP